MAGLGSRFTNAGYLKPKPFIDVNGKPMIVRVLENLSYPNASYILVARREHLLNQKDLVTQISKRFNVTLETLKFIPFLKTSAATLNSRWCTTDHFSKTTLGIFVYHGNIPY